MNISNEIRKLLIDNDYTLTQIAQIISKKKNKSFTVQNLSQKLKNGTVTLKEFEIILDALNYVILFHPKKQSQII